MQLNAWGFKGISKGVIENGIIYQFTFGFVTIATKAHLMHFYSRNFNALKSRVIFSELLLC